MLHMSGSSVIDFHVNQAKQTHKTFILWQIINLVKYYLNLCSTLLCYVHSVKNFYKFFE